MRLLHCVSTGSLSVTSPRLRGEVARQSPQGEGAAGEGDSPYDVLAESPPHPDPLPASGERESKRRSAR